VTTVLVELGARPVGQAVALVLAQNPVPPPDKGEEFGKASPIGLVVILLLGIATVLLIRNMTKRIRKLPPSFDPPSAGISGSGTPVGDDAAPRTTGSTRPAGPSTAGPAPPHPTDASADR
jgi:hypothetical protein